MQSDKEVKHLKIAHREKASINRDGYVVSWKLWVAEYIELLNRNCKGGGGGWMTTLYCQI
jgi:hypothetical protein